MEIDNWVPHRTSKLEDHKELITALRQARWPHRAIAEKLETEFGLEVDGTTISRFCIREGIVKGRAAKAQKAAELVPKAVPKKPKTAVKKKASSPPSAENFDILDEAIAKSREKDSSSSEAMFGEEL